MPITRISVLPSDFRSHEHRPLKTRTCPVFGKPRTGLSRFFEGQRVQKESCLRSISPLRARRFRFEPGHHGDFYYGPGIWECTFRCCRQLGRVRNPEIVAQSHRGRGAGKGRKKRPSGNCAKCSTRHRQSRIRARGLQSARRSLVLARYPARAA
jgi:hypothetical protein